MVGFYARGSAEAMGRGAGQRKGMNGERWKGIVALTAVFSIIYEHKIEEIPALLAV